LLIILPWQLNTGPDLPDGTAIITPGRTCLELGAGAGVVGIAVAALGGKCLMTDRAVASDNNTQDHQVRSEEILTNLQENIRLNAELVADRAGVAALEWGNDAEIEQVGLSLQFQRL
jgi:predicted nicotinamide N-methyase